MRLPRVLFLLAAAGIAAKTAAAQPAPAKPSEWLGGGGLLIGIPLGEFADATDEGFGVVGNVVFTPGGGPFGIRLQTGGLVYGSRTIPACRCPGTWRARHRGPLDRQLAAERRASAPSSSLARARCVPTPTHSPASGTSRPRPRSANGYDYYGDNSTTNYDDWTFAWSAGAGLLLPVSRSVAIDVGVQYVGNGTVRYLAEGDLLPSPGGAPPLIVPRQTEANLFTITVGITFGY